MHNPNETEIQTLEKRLEDEAAILKQEEKEGIYRELARLYNEAANLIVKDSSNYEEAIRCCSAAVEYGNKITPLAEDDLVDLGGYYRDFYKVYKLKGDWVNAEQECQNAIETLVRVIEVISESISYDYGHLGYCLVDLGYFREMQQKPIVAHDAYRAGIMTLERVQDQITDWGSSIPRAIARAEAGLKRIGPLPLLEITGRYVQRNLMGTEEGRDTARNKLPGDLYQKIAAPPTPLASHLTSLGLFAGQNSQEPPPTIGEASEQSDTVLALARLKL